MFSHGTVIIPLVILGYIWRDQSVFFEAICLLLISMLLNFALKVTFQIPLSPHLGKPGFAFPSGHMQSCLVLYGWLMTHIKNPRSKILIMGLLTGIAFSLIHCGYHNTLDILGGIFFGSLLLLAYRLLKTTQTHIILPVLLSFSTCLMLYIATIQSIIEHLWMAYYGLIGLMLSQQLFKDYPRSTDFQSKIAATLFAVASLVTIKILFSFLHLPLFLMQIQWMLMGACIPLSPPVGRGLIHHTPSH
jgi:undecaprenyl-diphosphatase